MVWDGPILINSLLLSASQSLIIDLASEKEGTCKQKDDFQLILSMQKVLQNP